MHVGCRPKSRRMTCPRLPLLPIVLLVLLDSAGVSAAPSLSDGLVQNITRLDQGDVFFVAGGECGVTKCGEVSGGTALSERPPGGYGGCACRCRGGVPLYREDRAMCVAQVTECPMAQFGADEGSTNVPLVFLPLPGQIIHPSKEIYFAEVNKTACAVSSAQYLTRTGWTRLREELDNDVPFSLYRDEGRTYLMWRGSEDMRTKVTGRVVVVKLACRSDHHVVLPCVAFRVQGTPPDLPNEIPAVFFSREDLFPPAPRSHAASLGTTLLLCALIGTLIYVGALVLYMRHKRQHLLRIETEKVDRNGLDPVPSTKTNPLMSMSIFYTDGRRSSCDLLTDKEESSRSFSSRSSSMADSLERQKQHDDNVEDDDMDSDVRVTVHSVNNSTPTAGMCLAALIERRPELHVNVVEELDSICRFDRANSRVPSTGNMRKKLYFNPLFLEPHMLKQPPAAAVEFLTKIREVINIAKDKMVSKRFTPCLPVISEERLCHEVDLAFNSDFLKSKHTAVSLKRENSRQRNYCSGCPGCKKFKSSGVYRNSLSEKEYCRSCASSDLKDTIVRKWLDRIPIIETVDEPERVGGLTVRVEGVPKSIKPKNMSENENTRENGEEGKPVNISSKSMPPTPPIRTCSMIEKPEIDIKQDEKEMEETKCKIITKKKDDDIINLPISPELKKKMNAVINELSKFRRIEPITPRSASPVTSEVATPFMPKLVIPITPKIDNSQRSKETAKTNISKDEIKKYDYEMDSLERSNLEKYQISSYNKGRADLRSNHKRKSSIIPMDKLEPMKKIQEMNSRLSKNLSVKDENNNKTSSTSSNGTLKCKSYTIQRSNLVSEVYINDFINTMSSTSDSEYSSPNSSIIHIGDVPTRTPSQLVIEVESIPETKSIKEEDYFDPDTLDRKPAPGKFLRGPIVKPKNIDHIFLKSPSSFKEDSISFKALDFDDDHNLTKMRRRPEDSIDSGVNISYRKSIEDRFFVKDPNHIYYENCLFSLNSGSRSLSEIFLERKEEDKPPPLPPKKKNGKKQPWAQNNTSKIIVNSTEDEYTRTHNNLTYRVTRSEPPQINTFIERDNKPDFHRPLILELKERTKHLRIKEEADENKDKSCGNIEFLSLDPNYDYYSTFEYQKHESTVAEKTNENKRQNKRSVKYRNKLISSHSKTEDSGYLSSDSNESRKKRKFLLQIRDKDAGLKELITDTDDVESNEDAHSESGAESIETNSVFFGSLRTLSSIRRAQEMEKMKNGFAEPPTKSNNGLKSSEECKELKNVISISSPRERLAALDDL